MRVNKIYIVVLLGCMITSTAKAQRSSIAKQRVVLDEAISTIEDYEAFATIADDEVRYSFEKLFVDENANVYDDLLGISKEQLLTVKEYSGKLTEGLRNKKATIKNIRKERLWQEDDLWKVAISFDKTLSYTNNCGIFFSSKEFYDTEYHLLATLVYDENTKKCKIESITGSVDSQRKLPDRFFAFKSEDKRDQQLTYQGKKMSFNSYGQALLEGTYEKSGFRYSDPDVELTPMVDECNNVSMKYKARKLRVKLHYDMDMGDALELSGAESINNHEVKSSSFGIDFGYVLPSKSVVKIGLFAGLGFSQSTIETDFQSSDYYYNTDADVDGDTYIRHYNNFRLSQKIKLTELLVPLYADINIKLHQLVSLYFDIGLKANLNISHSVDNTEGGAYIYGIYPQYDNLRLDEKWGFNGFGNKSYSNSDLANPDMTGVSGLTVDAFGGAGLRIGIPSTPLAIDVSANYLFGLMDVAKPEGSKIDLTGNINSPLAYNSVSGKNSTERVHNLIESFSSVKRKSPRLSIGVIYKF